MAGGGEVVATLVVGDAGSGKSQLLAEAADRSVVAPMFRVIGYEPEQQVPLAAASDLLRALVDTPAGRQLGVLLFDPARESSSALEPMRVFEAVQYALKRTKNRPTPESMPAGEELRVLEEQPCAPWRY